MEQNYLTLLQAVLLQAIRDCTHPEYRHDAKSFIESHSFDAIWEELAEDKILWPNADAARQMILGANTSVRRRPYH